jgi:phage-related protein
MRAFATEIKNLATDIGEVLLPVITPLLASLGEIVKKFSELSPETQKIIVAIAGVAAAIGPILVVVGMMAQGIGAITTVLGGLGAAAGGAGAAAGGLGTAFAALTGPIALAVAAIVGIVLVIRDLWKNNEEFRDSIKGIWNEISQSIKSAIDQITAWWTEWGPAIMNIVKPMWETIKTIISTAVKVVGEVISLFLNVITGDWEGAKKDLLDICKALWEGIKGIFTGLMNTLAGIWDLIVQVAANRWNTFKETILSPIRSAKETLLGIIETIKNAFANLRIEIPRPKLPKISVDWRSVGVGNAKVSIPDFNINWYKTGGIFARPSIIGVGEAGTEVVAPLDRLPGLIADALRDAMGGGQVAMAGGITVQNMYVRNDQDIKLVARELYNLQQTNARGRGLR